MNGLISRGATCAETITGVTSQLTMGQTLDALEAQPGKPPAIWQSADDYGEETTELQVACRILGDSCSYELKQMIEKRKDLLERAKAIR